MTSISKNVYIDKLDDIVNEYNNKYHRIIKMKPIDVQDNTYINFDKEVNDNDPKIKVVDHVRISKYKNIFTNGKEIIGTFYEKELQKIDQREFRIEKVMEKR